MEGISLLQLQMQIPFDPAEPLYLLDVNAFVKRLMSRVFGAHALQ